MRGVKFLVDKSGKKTAVVLDLRRNAALWEDVYDSALARSRAREPRESLASVRRRLQRTGNLKRTQMQERINEALSDIRAGRTTRIGKKADVRAYLAGLKKKGGGARGKGARRGA